MKNAFWIFYILFFLVSCRSTEKQVIVENWQIFESSITQHKTYQDPFEDVKLEVKYYRPDGKIVQFPGFYAGNHTWKFRILPDKTGSWKYEARFSDGSASKSGNFLCVESETKGMPITLKANPTWFGWSNGKAFLVRSLHVGDRFFAENWYPENRKLFLDWFQEQGYNTLSVASFLLNRETAGRGLDWQTPDLWDAEMHNPNPEEFDKLEGILNDLLKRNIVVFPFAGFIGRDSDILPHSKNWSQFIEYSLARLGAYPNLVFNIAGPEPLLRSKPFLNIKEINELGKQISKLDVHDHLLTVHNATGDDVFRTMDWVSFITLQGPKKLNRDELSNGILRTRHPSKPLFAQETLWPGNMHHPPYSIEDIRKNGLVMLMSGAMINFGDMDGNSSSGFSGTLDPVNLHQEWHDEIHNVWDFFDRFNWWNMTPRQDLVDSGYCLANPGLEYLVYLPKGGIVNMKLVRGNYTVDWWDPSKPDKPVNTTNIEDGLKLHLPLGNREILLHIASKQ